LDIVVGLMKTSSTLVMGNGESKTINKGALVVDATIQNWSTSTLSTYLELGIGMLSASNCHEPCDIFGQVRAEHGIF